MIRAWMILMVAATHLVPGCQGLTWHNDIEDDAQMIRCVGAVASFHWNFTLEENESVVGISWVRRTNDDQVVNLANFAFSRFKTLDKRIIKVSRAGIQLSDLFLNDTAAYMVQVRLGAYTVKKTAHLLVAEHADTETGLLDATVVGTPASNGSHNGAPAEQGQRLKCGHFSTLGHPPMSVIWKDPNGNFLTSTSYKDGFFYLDLPEEHKGGDYYCQLNLTSPAAKCLAHSSDLRKSYLVGVVGKKPVAPSTAGLDGGVLAGIIIAVLLIIIIAIVVAVYLWNSKRRGKSYAPKEPESPGPQDQEALEPLKV